MSNEFMTLAATSSAQNQISSPAMAHREALKVEAAVLDPLTVADDLRLQVEADDLDLSAAKFSQ